MHESILDIRSTCILKTFIQENRSTNYLHLESVRSEAFNFRIARNDQGGYDHPVGDQEGERGSVRTVAIEIVVST